MAVIKGVHYGSWKFLIGCYDDDDVPVGLHPPEECSGKLPLKSN